MKKNIRVIPKNIHSKLRRLGNTVVAGTSIAFTENQLKSGALEHLGIYFDNGVNAYETSVIPDPLQGKYSLKNVFGEEISEKTSQKKLITLKLSHLTGVIALMVHILLDYLTRNIPETLYHQHS